MSTEITGVIPPDSCPLMSNAGGVATPTLRITTCITVQIYNNANKMATPTLRITINVQIYKDKLSGLSLSVSKGA